MTKVVVVNGPNLGRLGVRQPDVYGKQDLETLRKLCTEWGHELGLDVEVRQSDDEAEISNPSARDEFRKRSVISPVATGTITGMGFYGYKLAIEAVAHLLEER